MGSFQARHSSDPLDIEIQGKVKSAQRLVSQAIHTLRRSGRPRYQTRKTYTQLMGVSHELSRVKSTLPVYLQDPELLPDPDLLPEWLKERSTQVGLLIHRANQSYAMARRCLEIAEQAFNHVELTFAQEEIAALQKVQHQLLNIEATLRNYRGISSAPQETPIPEVPIPEEPDVPVAPTPDLELE